MRSTAGVTVGPGGRLEGLTGGSPLAFRPASGMIWLVGTAASPVGNDDVEVRVQVEPGAAATVRTNAATVLWAGVRTRHHLSVSVGEAGSLDWQPEAVVATARCRHEQTAQVILAAGAYLRWRETLVLGRCGEAPGHVLSHLRVERGGAVLFDHALEIGAPGWDGPAVIGSNRVVAFELRTGAGDPPEGAGPGWCVSPVEGGGGWALAVGRSALEAEDRLAEAARLLPPRAVRSRSRH